MNFLDYSPFRLYNVGVSVVGGVYCKHRKFRKDSFCFFKPLQIIWLCPRCSHVSILRASHLFAHPTCSRVSPLRASHMFACPMFSKFPSLRMAHFFACPTCSNVSFLRNSHLFMQPMSSRVPHVRLSSRTPTESLSAYQMNFPWILRKMFLLLNFIICSLC